jgi:predicted transcriptional regulator
MKHRSRTNIIWEMLEAARLGESKTHIMYAAGLSFSQTVEYMEYLQHNDLLRYDSVTNKFWVTEKGLKFLDKLIEINDLVPLKKVNGDPFLK